MSTPNGPYWDFYDDPYRVHLLDSRSRGETVCGRVADPRRGKEYTPPGEFSTYGCRHEPLPLCPRCVWWDWYAQYLKSPEWASLRQRVLTRAHGMCEGCADREAVHVHHLTYEHAGRELLWELRAVCEPCHRNAHSRSDAHKWSPPIVAPTEDEA